MIDFISPCPEFNRGLCQASHPHENDTEKEGKPLDAICEICRYSLNLNNPHPAHECKLSRGLDNILARRKRKYEEDEIRREREQREARKQRPPPQKRPEPSPGPSGVRDRLEPLPVRRDPAPYSREWGQKRHRNW